MFEFKLMGQTYREVTEPDMRIDVGDLIYFFDTHPDRDAFCYMFIRSGNHLVGVNWIGRKAGLLGDWVIHEDHLKDNGGVMTLGWLEQNWEKFSRFPREKTKFLKWQDRDYDPNDAVDPEFFARLNAV